MKSTSEILAPEESAFEREIADWETRLFTTGLEQEAAELTHLIARLKPFGDPLLLGHAFSFQARNRIASGQHQAAITSAESGLRAFEAVPAYVAGQHAGVHSELFRALATAQLKLGKPSAALPNLDQAVQIARAALASSDDFVGWTFDAGAYSALHALIRGLVTLGIAFFAIREIDMAIQMYSRALATGDAYPIAYERFPDDMMLVTWNLTDALHQRAINRRAAGAQSLAAHDVAAASRLLDPQTWKISPQPIEDGDDPPFLRCLSANVRDGYFASIGRNLLLTGQPAKARAMFERQLAEIERKAYADEWGKGDAEAGIAQASFDLGMPQVALEHCRRALQALDCHDEFNTRAAVHEVRAKAYRSLHEFEAAYAALEEFHRIRTSLEAAATQQYAAHMNAQLGLERARTDAESHRRIAQTLETVGRVGQEITANLDTDAILAILHRSVIALLHAPTFLVWLLDSPGGSLSLKYGIDGGLSAHHSLSVDHAFSIASRAARERRELFGEPTASDGLPLVVADTRIMQTALFSPLIVGERVLGVVCIQSDRSTGYSENERSIFRTLCTYGAIAIDNAAAYHKLGRTVEALQAAQAELASRTAEFERLSMTDPLTGVANRRFLHDRAQVEITEVKRKNGRLSVAMFDIDHFKDVNDTYGHAAGDAVLQNVARVAKSWLRPVDLIARIGGEEFALLLPGAGIHDACEIAERIRASIAEAAVDTGAKSVTVTSSFGVAEFDTTIDSLDHALGCADAALYTAKQAGRNRVHCAS